MSSDENNEAVAADPVPNITFDAQLQGTGWTSAGVLVPGESLVVGTTGRSLRLEGMRFSVSYPDLADGQTAPTGSLEANVYVEGSRWQGWRVAGQVVGTESQSKRIEAVRLRLTGELADKYDIYYRVYCQGVNWMPWTKNGETAGTYGKFYRVEAVEVLLVEKGSASPSTGAAYAGYTGLWDRGYVEGSGWQSYVGSGDVIGTTGQSKQLQAIQLNVAGYEETGGIRYRAYVAGSGWQSWVSDGATAGVTGKRMEAVNIELTGQMATNYDIYYRVHIASKGWMAWTKNGGNAGSTGYDLRVEAIEIRIVKKGDTSISTSGRAYLGQPVVSHRGYVKSTGWESWSTGTTIGTAGSGKALTGIQFSLSGDGRPDGTVQYRICDVNGNWGTWYSNGYVAGSENGTAIGAVQMSLSGEMLDNFDLYYRTYVTGIGWLGWTKNGPSAGCGVTGYTVECVELRLVKKGASAPGSTSNAYIPSNVGKLGWQNPSGYYQVSRYNVTLPTAAYSTPFSYVTPSRISLTATRQQCINAFVQRAYEYIGTPYVWNYSRQVGVGVDCIGLVYQCAYATGMDMGEFNPYNHYYSGTNGWHSHDAMNVWNYGAIQRLSFSQRQYGDLIFYPGHVAIYIGNNQIIEASSISGKVVISSVYRYSTIYGVGRLYV